MWWKFSQFFVVVSWCINGNDLASSLTRTHYAVNYAVNVELKLIICRDILMLLKLNCVFVASYSQLKTEADSRDMTGHPHDDKTRSYLCTVCHKRFTTKSQLTRHNKRHTGENDEYLCTQCDKRFSSQNSLCQHMNIHAGKYKCTECGRCFGSSSHLAVHRRSHSGEKPFECAVCSKRFIKSCNLVVHSRIHSREKPFKCHMCEKAFSRSSDLHSHIRVHTEIGRASCRERV